MTPPRSAPAAARNRYPILDVLRARLPRPGTVLEIASGTGEHAVWFSQAMADVTWQPTDGDEQALATIGAWRAAEGGPNLLPPRLLDAASGAWPVERADAIVSINMIHISAWAATLGLMAGAERVLQTGGLMFLYGPFKVGGTHTAPSNAAFDADLRARNPAWGVRDADDVTALAARHRLVAEDRIAMPANNFSLLFRRLGS